MIPSTFGSKEGMETREPSCPSRYGLLRLLSVGVHNPRFSRKKKVYRHGL